MWISWSACCLDGGNHFGMAMSCGDYGNSRSEVQKRVAVDIFDQRAPAHLRDERVLAGVGGRYDLLVSFDDMSRLGTWQRGHDAWQL